MLYTPGDKEKERKLYRYRSILTMSHYLADIITFNVQKVKVGFGGQGSS